MRQKLSWAVAAALFGFAVGAVCVSAVGAIKVMLSPGVQYSSVKAFLLSPLLTFAEGLVWSLVGGTIFVLPQALLLLTAYSFAFKPDWTEVRHRRIFTLGFTAALWVPVFWFGFRTRFLDASLVAAGMLMGVRVSLRLLNRRLHLQLQASGA